MKNDLGGFSLVELIVAIVLVGILATVAFARFMSGGAANPAIASNQLVSAIRSAQQRAIGRSDVSITVRPQGGQLALLVEEDGTEIQRSTSTISGVTLSGDVNVLDSCTTTPGSDAITSSDAMVLEFDALGDLLEGGVENSAGFPEAITTGARICVNNDPRYSVCVSKAGYAYAGDCDD